MKTLKQLKQELADADAAWDDAEVAAFYAADVARDAADAARAARDSAHIAYNKKLKEIEDENT